MFTLTMYYRRFISKVLTSVPSLTLNKLLSFTFNKSSLLCSLNRSFLTDFGHISKEIIRKQFGSSFIGYTRNTKRTRNTVRMRCCELLQQKFHLHSLEMAIFRVCVLKNNSSYKINHYNFLHPTFSYTTTKIL